MSGKKILERATRTNRVVAIPSKKKEVEVGIDKNGEPIIEKVQLYNIKKLH